MRTEPSESNPARVDPAPALIDAAGVTTVTSLATSRGSTVSLLRLGMVADPAERLWTPYDVP